MGTVLALIFGFILDIIIGDPRWMPHPIRVIGNLIDKTQNVLLRSSSSPLIKKINGFILLAVISLGTYFIYFLIVTTAYNYSFIVGVIIESLIIFQILATKCLKDETMRIYNSLKKKDLNEARKWISYLVSRDTSLLEKKDIIKASVETISENIVDGVTSPIFFCLIGGAPLGMFYKSVNTLDSMVGYKNEKYFDFGYASAKFDDILNYIPARITGIIIVAVSYIMGYDGKNSLKILIRDRNNHSSPNSPYSEAPVAGALNIQLGGTATYFGVTENKPTMGDANKEISLKHIVDANKILYGTTIFTIIFFSTFKILISIYL